jgi:HK97 gp10 family phage protein
LGDVFSVKFSSGAERALDRLGEELGEKALRAAAFAGADIIKNEVVLQAPELTGLLKKNIIVKRLEDKSDGNLKQVYLVTVRTGRIRPARNAKGKKAKKFGNAFTAKPTEAFYWRFVEFGTSKTRPNPFMRRALSNSRTQATNAIKDTLRLKLREFKQIKR